MSRGRGRKAKSPSVDYRFTAVRLTCPELHELGKVVRQQGRYMLTAGLSKDGSAGEFVKVRATCEKCAATGKRSDLQASWAKVVAVLDSTRGTSDYMLGG